MRGSIDLIFMGFTGRRTPKILAMDVDVDWRMNDVEVNAVSSDVTDDTDDVDVDAVSSDVTPNVQKTTYVS